MYNSILLNYGAASNLEIVPAHFKEDFRVCMGIEENISHEKIYNSAIRITKETIEFLNKQNLKEIKNKEFFDLLNQANKYL